ncbi:uncharacterized protein LOC112627028 [Theropithecus gelada]|uniref:uncharacterized protein LOC112627028 n=1 Tax=Theropithecus gelada TaxID=9565 RepID=UPI000DC18163|nr:uncharacterized protein LOC112627028 [Theropithecus gelada]
MLRDRFNANKRRQSPPLVHLGTRSRLGSTLRSPLGNAGHEFGRPLVPLVPRASPDSREQGHYYLADRRVSESATGEYPGSPGYWTTEKCNPNLRLLKASFQEKKTQNGRDKPLQATLNFVTVESWAESEDPGESSLRPSPRPSANHQAPCKSPLPFSKPASAAAAALAAPPQPHFLPSPPLPSFAPARAAAGEEGSAGCLMHMQTDPPPPSTSCPLLPPPPVSPAAPALLDVQFSELWSRAAVSQKKAYVRSWSRRGKGRKALPLKSSRRSSLRLAEWRRKVSKNAATGFAGRFCTETELEMPFSP